MLGKRKQLEEAIQPSVSPLKEGTVPTTTPILEDSFNFMFFEDPKDETNNSLNSSMVLDFPEPSTEILEEIIPNYQFLTDNLISPMYTIPNEDLSWDNMTTLDSNSIPHRSSSETKENIIPSYNDTLINKTFSKRTKINTLDSIPHTPKEKVFLASNRTIEIDKNTKFFKENKKNGTNSNRGKVFFIDPEGNPVHVISQNNILKNPKLKTSKVLDTREYKTKRTMVVLNQPSIVVKKNTPLFQEIKGRKRVFYYGIDGERIYIARMDSVKRAEFVPRKEKNNDSLNNLDLIAYNRKGKMVYKDNPTEEVGKDTPLYKDKEKGIRGQVFCLNPLTNQRMYVKSARNIQKKLKKQNNKKIETLDAKLYYPKSNMVSYNNPNRAVSKNTVFYKENKPRGRIFYLEAETNQPIHVIVQKKQNEKKTEIPAMTNTPADIHSYPTVQIPDIALSNNLTTSFPQNSTSAENLLIEDTNLDSTSIPLMSIPEMREILKINDTEIDLTPSQLNNDQLDEKSCDNLGFFNDLSETNDRNGSVSNELSENLFEAQPVTISSNPMNLSLSAETKTEDDLLKDAIPLSRDQVKRVIKGDNHRKHINQNTPLFKEKERGKHAEVFFIDPLTKKRIYVERANEAQKKLKRKLDELIDKKVDVSSDTLDRTVNKNEITTLDATFYYPKYPMCSVEDGTRASKNVQLYQEKKHPKRIFYFNPKTNQPVQVRRRSQLPKKLTSVLREQNIDLGSSSIHPMSNTYVKKSCKSGSTLPDSEILKDAVPFKPKQYHQRYRKDTLELIDRSTQLYINTKIKRNTSIFFVEGNKRIFTAVKKFANDKEVASSVSAPYFSSSEAHISQRLLSAEQPIIQTTIETPSTPQTSFLHSFNPLFHIPILRLQSSSSETDKSDNINIDESLSIFNRR